MEDKLNIRRLAIVNESFGMGGCKELQVLLDRILQINMIFCTTQCFTEKIFIELKKIFFLETLRK